MKTDGIRKLIVALLFPLLFILPICAQVSFCSPALAAPSGEKTEAQEAVVTGCLDGNTVRLMDRRVVRLAAIDAPNLTRDRKREQFYAKEAKLALQKFLAGAKVYLVASVPGSLAKDQFGRFIADIYLPDGESAADYMVASGAAYVCPQKNATPEAIERLLKLQRTAIENRVGFWNHLLRLGIAAQTYIGDSDSLYFFPADCPSAQQIKPRNRVYFGTLMDAFLAGFAPAPVCVFWPDASPAAPLPATREE